ncbi:hypothetical protein [Actinoallomurus iriomotensis]|uniref:Uncharacterized protein n=1 Tax=Actinoallomurus iriomotensis TaxID=478107 RepID=A0A9W6VUK1_9ACTN|nr:hypothetical protein [Actinoallomurus iriomotensis]GLY78756.1 hypothetical protein Airi01_070230 [Actinoallomurus iriomotensis]
MSLLYEFFVAEDDRAAAGVLTTGCPRPVFRDEGIPPAALAAIESLLTGRTEAEITADPRHGAGVAELVDEDAGVAECGVLTVTDTLTRALAAASASDPGWHTEAAVRGLAPVARHAVATGHRMYCLWTV